MSIQIRPYAPEDHEMLATWWKGHGWDVVPAAILPKLGAVAFYSNRVDQHEDLPVVAAFLYMDNSVGVCWLEWLVSNPQAPKLHVLRAIDAVIGFLTEEAKRLDYGVMITTCRQESLVRFYEKAGFQVTDKGVTHLIKSTGGK